MANEIESMRIAMIGAFGFRPKKTMRSRAFRMARELVRMGHTVRLIMPPWHTPEESGRTWTEDGVEIEYVTVSGGVPATLARMIGRTAAFKPDIIHCFKPIAYSAWGGRTFYHFTNTPVVMDMDDWEGWGGWNDANSANNGHSRLTKSLISRQERLGMRDCHALTVASRALETIALSHGIPPSKVTYLPNASGIDVGEHSVIERAKWFSPLRNPMLLIYSRFFEFDVSRLVEIIGKTAASIPNLRILLVGASLHEGDGERFTQLMAARGLTERVEDVGWVDEGLLPALLQRAHVGIYLMDDTLLNRAKCPVKLADMIQIGLPIVGENVGQVAAYVDHGRTGLLRQSGDVDGVTADLIHLLTHPDIAREMGAAGKQHYQQFGWDRTAEKLELIYTQLHKR